MITSSSHSAEGAESSFVVVSDNIDPFDCWEADVCNHDHAPYQFHGPGCFSVESDWYAYIRDIEGDEGADEV